MNVFELMATLSLDTAEYERRLKGAEGEGEESNKKIGSKFVALGKVAGKALAAAAGAAASGVTAITTMAVKNYASYEQLVGGVETLFQGSAAKVQKYANDAYRTAGMSANDYMETVTSFSASLISSLNGNTKKAADIANKAIIDMSDNANKMGTSMESITNAYQGFAKQNYTMLDNLKLGYGGTKEEMKRLLSDAEKMPEAMGRKFDLNNYADVVEAIHVVQENMGITGTTADEAAKTIEGSFKSMKASWSNLVTAMAGGGNVEESLTIMGDTTITFFKKNLIPRIQTTFEGMSGAISKAVPKVVSAIPNLFGQIVPGFMTATTNAVMTIGKTAGDLLKNNLPQILSSAMSGGSQLVQIGVGMINKIASGLQQGVPAFFENALPMLLTFSEWINENAGLLINAGLNFIMQLAQGIANGIPLLIEYIPQIIINIAGVINDNAPNILATGVMIIVTLAKGLIQAIPTLVSNIPTIIKAVIAVFMAYNWLQLGASIIKAMVNGIKSMVTAIPNTMKSIAQSAGNMFKSVDWGNLGISVIKMLLNGIKSLMTSIPNTLKTIGTAAFNAFKSISWYNLGANVVSGIAKGILGGVEKIASAAKSVAKKALDAAKGFLGIHSPSRVFKKEVGHQIAAGTAEGIEDNTKQPVKAVKDMVDAMEDTTILTTKASSSGQGGSGNMEKLIREIIDRLDRTEDKIFTAVARVLDNMGIKWDDREVARIIMEVLEA